MTPLDPHADMFFVYVLRSRKDFQFYAGYTNDLKRRLAEHNSGINYSTRYRRPLDLMYYEAYLHLEDAMRREQYLKTGMGKRDLRKRLYNSLNLFMQHKQRV